MNCFPNNDYDLGNRPACPSRYAQTLEAARSQATALASSEPISSHAGDSTERWTLEDAAAYWFPEWQSRKSGEAHLSADAITGLAATAFLRHYRDLPLLARFFTSLRMKVHLATCSTSTTHPRDNIPASVFCRAAHVAFRPGVIKLDEKHSSTGFRSLASKTLGPCSQECCREAETILGGCIPQDSFNNALNSGVLLPVRAMNASPITLLLPRLACWEKSPPTIAVRSGDTHAKALYAPYWVHDAINNMARVIPGLLAKPEVQAEIRAGVTMLMPKYLTLRKEGKAAERRGTIPARTKAGRDEHIANAIWQSSGAEPMSFRRYRYPPTRPPHRM